MLGCPVYQCGAPRRQKQPNASRPSGWQQPLPTVNQTGQPNAACVQSVRQYTTAFARLPSPSATDVPHHRQQRRASNKNWQTCNAVLARRPKGTTVALLSTWPPMLWRHSWRKISNAECFHVGCSDASSSSTTHVGSADGPASTIAQRRSAHVRCRSCQQDRTQRTTRARRKSRKFVYRRWMQIRANSPI